MYRTSLELNFDNVAPWDQVAYQSPFPHAGTQDARSSKISVEDYVISNFEFIPVVAPSPPEVVLDSRAKGKWYILEVTIVVARCYVDLSKETMGSHQPKVCQLWTNIAARYNHMKPKRHMHPKFVGGTEYGGDPKRMKTAASGNYTTNYFNSPMEESFGTHVSSYTYVESHKGANSRAQDHGYNKKGDEEIQFGSHKESLILRRQGKLLGAWSRGFGFVTFNEVVVRKVFDEIRERNVVSWNSLLWGYVKCGDLAMALSVFDEMLEKDVVSWTSMVSGYAKGLSRAQAERAATAATRSVNAYGQKEEGPSRWQERKEAKRQMYLMSTEKQVRSGERKDLKSSTSSVASASQCQKCYQMGHWTCECKNERVYISRPSQTQQVKNLKHKSDKESDNDW
ncbi:hypothetical protein SASPL_150104 [Salvia splendens]|uniref:Pentatricopeptide repeat-containing protein n=1 Tax=Salvia splendens TaxID=180675 RepID=A0A8X8W5J0_SALSN|nr:hypothetical protein SASPL_150104 [Salvia splendens]